jgi:serine/threonine protein kinase/Tfp pilus assembly protein PilF
MGAVYLAERADGAFRMSAAVKVVPLALASPDIEERFRRERQFLASLDHPKVARLIDGGVTGSGLPFLVMEFVDGLSIDRYCDTHQLDARSRIALMRQVLEALIYVHGCQVIHRDLKPSNIMVDASGNAKLLDFGTARLVDASGDTAITRTGVFAFTPECASPEQVAGKPLTFSSDVYSAGVLLYRLLTGRLPYRFASHSPAAVADTINHTEPEPSGLDGPLDAILSTALSKDPEKRYASAVEMDADLARYLDGEPVQARRARTRLRRVSSLALLAALLLLIAAAGWFVSRRMAVKQPPSIAVLPFKSLSSGPESGYLSSGLTAEITDGLSRTRTLRVIARASAAQLTSKPADLRQAAQSMNVTHVLESTVERTGDQVKIVSSLERTSDGARLWTNIYHRPVADIGAIETDLEARIAASLGIAEVPKKAHMVPDQAHDYYLKARFEENLGTPETNAQAQQDYRRALEIDPEYAAACLGLGDAIWNRRSVSSQRALLAELRQAEQLWQRASQLDPGLSAAHAALGLYAEQYDWDWDRAEREFQASLAAGQSAGAEMSLGLLYLILGRRTEADEHLRRARDLDPLSRAAAVNTTMALELEGRPAEAREEMRLLVSQNPGAVVWQIELNALDAQLGRTGPAIVNLRKLAQRVPDANIALAQAEARAGRRDDALRILRPFEQNYKNGDIPMFQFALVYAALDDEPSTVKWLERSMDAHEGGATHIHIETAFARFQNTPAFHALKKRMNLDW